jgi:predicted ATPase
MRIAIAGSHRSGKSSLAEGLLQRLQGYVLVEEPYAHMVEDGYEFSDPPTAEEFMDQLHCCLASIAASGRQTLFDRSPVDFLAYALALSRRSRPHALEEWLDLCREGIEKLDAIVFCPIEEPDRIVIPQGEHRKLRRRTNDALWELIVEDRFDLMGETTIIEVQGDLSTRVETALRLLESAH